MEFIVGSILSVCGAILTYHYGRKSFLKPQFFIFIVENKTIKPTNKAVKLKIIDSFSNRREFLNISEFLILTKTQKDISNKEIIQPLTVYGNKSDCITNFSIINKNNFEPNFTHDNKLVLSSDLIRDKDFIHIAMSNMSDSSEISTSFDYKIENFKNLKFYFFRNELNKFFASTLAFFISLFFLIISSIWVSNDINPYQLEKNYFHKKNDTYYKIDKNYYDGFNAAINNNIKKRGDSILITGLNYYKQSEIEDNLEKKILATENTSFFKLFGSQQYFLLGKNNIYLNFSYNSTGFYIYLILNILGSITVIIYYLINLLYKYPYLWNVHKLLNETKSKE